MKHLLILFSWLLLSPVISGQINQKTITKIEKYPRTFDHYESLADKIKTDFKSDESRAAAIFTWMAKNIAYDISAYSSRKSQSISFTYSSQAEKEQKERAIQERLASQTLTSRKAVCQGYAELYRLLCLACDIECVTVSGFSKTTPQDIGKKLIRPDHAWNAVKLNQKWYLLDVTWAAGSVNNNVFEPEFTPHYFKTPPERFFLNHYPENEEWRLTSKTKSDFIKLPLFYSAYFKSPIQVTKPQSGLITQAKGGQIKVEIITKEPLGRFSYKYSDERYMKKAEGTRKGNKLILNMACPKQKNGYLDIIFDAETIVTYQLKVR